MFSNHTGINITETKLQLVEICFKENAFYLENVDQALLKETITPDISYEILIEILHESYDKIVKKKPLNSPNISFALPNNFFKIFEIPYEESMIKKDLLSHFKWELSILFPDVDAENYLVQHIEVNKSGYRSEKHAIVFGIDRMLINSINNFCLKNDLILKYIDNVHLASNAFLYLNKSESQNEISLSFHIGQKYSSISAIDGVTPFFFKVLNPKSQNIFDELTLAVNNLKELGVQLGDFKRVLLYGQDVAEEFENRLKAFFKIPLKKVNPFEHLRASESVKNNPYYKLKSNSFSAATGIALRII
jgi:Tfp pilus assembly PilM family ATPase